jgi:ubiquinone/menaquinone biosynthesis C-methylase UbiE
MTDQLFTDGAAYERLMGRWSRVVGQAFLNWVDVPKHLRWLDAGCGNGAFTEELIDRVRRRRNFALRMRRSCLLGMTVLMLPLWRS